jgi:hypothetical protein
MNDCGELFFVVVALLRRYTLAECSWKAQPIRKWPQPAPPESLAKYNTLQSLLSPSPKRLVYTALELSLAVSYTRSRCGCAQKRAGHLEEEGMTPAVTSEAGKQERNLKKTWFFVCLCAVAIGLIFVPLRTGQTTVQFLAGIVLGLAIGGILSELSRGRKG